MHHPVHHVSVKLLLLVVVILTQLDGAVLSTVTESVIGKNVTRGTNENYTKEETSRNIGKGTFYQINHIFIVGICRRQKKRRERYDDKDITYDGDPVYGVDCDDSDDAGVAEIYAAEKCTYWETGCIVVNSELVQKQVIRTRWCFHAQFK